MLLDASNVCGLIDNNLAELIHTVIVVLKFGIPLLLLIFGMLDFAKGVIASKEDEIKSGQRMFIKRLISAIIAFFIVTVVQLIVGIVDDKDSGVWQCANLIMNGNSPEYSETYDDMKNQMNENEKVVIKCNDDLLLLRSEIIVYQNGANCNANIDIIGENQLEISSLEMENKCTENEQFINQMKEIFKTYSCSIE